MEFIKHKYVRFGSFDSFIFFPEIIDHDTFLHLKPTSAGFCYLNDPKEVICFGKSVTLKMQSKPEDSALATRQVHGVDAMIDFMNINRNPNE